MPKIYVVCPSYILRSKLDIAVVLRLKIIADYVAIQKKTELLNQTRKDKPYHKPPRIYGINIIKKHLLLAHGSTSTTFTDRCCQRTHRVFSGLPVNAGVRDADALFATFKAFGNLLVALTDVGLNHDTHDAVLTLAQLLTDTVQHLDLVAVVLLRIAFRIELAYCFNIASFFFFNFFSPQGLGLYRAQNNWALCDIP